MKKYILIFCLIASISNCFSQTEASDFTKKESDRPRDPRADMMNFVPNEVLVKFKDDVTITPGTTLKSAGISSVDQLLKANGVSSLEKLFPNETKLKSAQILKDPTGRDMKIPSLHNIYKITVPQLKSTGSAPADIFKFMEEMKALSEVEYAEPNYIFTIGDFKPAGPEMTMLEAMEQSDNSNISKTATGLIPNDPLYNSQWGIPACNIDDVWNTTTGDSTAIIAILDTGVDWQHPDLASNIWKNKQEIPDNGRDDDGNGLIDDVRGWDYINEDNNPMDDNSHGTHLAGIAAAVGNNGIGIAGVNWKAKIMPVKVFQSSGKGDVATIAKGVTYASSKGATVINMSFGSYSESLTLKNALANAYATSVLVAAAGNDALCIGPGLCPDKQLGMPMYPGGYSFVLGVEANTTGSRAGFSNYDQDGPVFSGYSDLLNYELKAPGDGILSCVPGGNYREYNGTSMAAPLVAGAVSLYRKQKPTESQELLFGNLINSIGQHLDLEKALNIIPEPRLDIVSYAVSDTLDGDSDGRPDAGETIELKVKVRNTWGQANDVKVGLEFGDFEDKTTATILTSEASIGAVSAYSAKENTIALKLKLAANINDGRDIVLKLKTWYGDHLGGKIQIITINVENGVELKGILSQNMTLYPNKQYIITDNLAIPEGVTLTIKPGTTLKFGEKKRMILAGTLSAIGTKDSTICFTKRSNDLNWAGILIEYSAILNANYCVIEYAGNVLNWGDPIIRNNGRSCLFKNTRFIYNGMPGLNWGFELINSEINASCFYYNFWNLYGMSSNANMINNNIISNKNRADNLRFGGAFYYGDFNKNFKNNLFSNYSFTDNEINMVSINSSFNIIKIDSTYFGTNLDQKINNALYDLPERGEGEWFDISNKKNRPFKLAHGIVWKVLVNGKDAQDEFDQLDPLGVGKQKLEVYFNRTMDKKYPPTVSMGVRYPYSQTAIAENGSWNADATVYTVYGTIGLGTGDGINTIRVTGAKDLDHFEIPIEDRRFRVVVNAAGSLSEGFEATPGMGKVALKWENPAEGVSDLLGYNIYRFSYKPDLTASDTVMINSSMVAGTEFTDFDVLPATKYFYAYKTVRTNLTESNFSKIVAATPLTAAKGDANGDLNVNVLDITSVLAFLLNNNPQPFIFEAADVNSDKAINVLDIVGVVNLVLNPAKSATFASGELISLYLKNDTLFMDAPQAVAGLQFDFSGILSMDEIQKLPILDGFETGYSLNSETFRFLAYSLSGKSIPAGNSIPLLKLKKGSGILSSIFSDRVGQQINSQNTSTGLWNFRNQLDQKTAELGQNYPNPLNKSTTIPLKIYEPVDEAVIRIVNTQGQELDIIRLKNPDVGELQISWNAGSNKGLLAYRLEIRRGNQQFLVDVKKMIVN
jgi:subtilisin family serine protease